MPAGARRGLLLALKDERDINGIKKEASVRLRSPRAGEIMRSRDLARAWFLPPVVKMLLRVGFGEKD